MNRLQLRKKLVEVTGRHDLVTDYPAADYTDNGADYFIDAGMEYLDLMFGYLKPRQEERFQTTGGSLLIPELKQITAAKWKDSAGDITKLKKVDRIENLEEIYEDPLEVDAENTPAHICMYNHTTNRQTKVEAELDSITELYQIVKGQRAFLGAYLRAGVIKLGVWNLEGEKGNLVENTILVQPHSMFMHGELGYYASGASVYSCSYLGDPVNSITPGGTPYLAFDELNNRLITNNATDILAYNLDFSGATTLFPKPANATYMAVMGSYIYIYNSNTKGIRKYDMTGTQVTKVARPATDVVEMSAENGKLYVSVSVTRQLEIYDEDLNLISVEASIDPSLGVPTHFKVSNGYKFYWKEGQEIADDVLFYAYPTRSTSSKYNVLVLPPSSETGTLIIRGVYTETIDAGADDFTNYWMTNHAIVTRLAAERELMVIYKDKAGENLKTSMIASLMSAFDKDRLSEELDMEKPVTIEG